MSTHNWIFHEDSSEAAKDAIASFYEKRSPDYIGLKPEQTINNLLEQFFASLIHDMKGSVLEEIQTKVREALFPGPGQ